MRISPRIQFNENIILQCGDEAIETKAIDLSLQGIKIENALSESCKNKDQVKVSFEMNGKPVTLNGKLYRNEQKEMVIVFNETPEKISETVGSFITQKIYESQTCPFCEYHIEKTDKYCPKCGMYLDFSSPNVIRVISDFKLGKIIEKLTKEEKDSIVESTISSNMEMIGTNEKMKEVFHLIRKYAATDYPVLIVGETGTGKELTAKAIHQKSNRANKPFVVVNCASIPSELLEAELFGYEKGAFTGADRRKPGKIELANGGTLFLDEIGDMPYNLQAKLLRFLQEYTFERLGGTETLTANVRIIAATNVNLKKAIEEGKFREDLYYRLSVLTIELPPLRERGEDVVIMAKYFVDRYSKEIGKNIKGLTKDAIELIRTYSWPGNVRELINVIRKAVVLTDKEYIDAEDLDIKVDPSEVENISNVLDIRKHTERLEKKLLKEAFIRTRGNITKMAKLLGISRPKVYKLLEKHNIGEIHIK